MQGTSRAIRSLPTPLSPVMKTVESTSAMRRASETSACMAKLVLTTSRPLLGRPWSSGALPCIGVSVVSDLRRSFRAIGAIPNVHGTRMSLRGAFLARGAQVAPLTGMENMPVVIMVGAAAMILLGVALGTYYMRDAASLGITARIRNLARAKRGRTDPKPPAQRPPSMELGSRREAP